MEEKIRHTRLASIPKVGEVGGIGEGEDGKEVHEEHRGLLCPDEAEEVLEPHLPLPLYSTIATTYNNSA